MEAPSKTVSSAARLRSAELDGAARDASLWQRFSFWLVLAVFCGMALAWSLIAALLYPLLPRRLGATVGQFAIMSGFRGGLYLMHLLGVARFDLRAVDAARAAGPSVIACNHLALIDALLVVSRLPRAVLIAKADLWRNPALAGSMRLAGYLRNDAPLSLLRAGRDALREGRHVVIFPEGTRGDGRALGPFRPGFAAMAKAAGVPVQTVLLSSDTPYLGPGWKLTRMPKLPAEYRVRLGRRFTVQGSSVEAAAAIERYVRAELFS